jgi:hypothetical protein
VANETPQNDVAHTPGAPQPPLATVDAIALGQRGASRRRFARAGAGATGVLLTLASQPGMACDICMSASGYQSYSKTMTAASHKEQVTCTGRNPAYWKGTNSWPRECPSSTTFSQHFTCNGSTNSTYGVTSCMKILTPQSFDSHGVGVYLMAMYLNVLSKKTSFMTVEQVRAIWNSYRDTGYYSPTAGVKWDASQIVFYLSGTMD